MLTLREVKQLAGTQKMDGSIPTGKQLGEGGAIVAFKEMEDGAKLAVYRNGYSTYRVGRHVTVFPVCACRGYHYGADSGCGDIQEEFFDSQPWYIRLLLEGEDRLSHNLEAGAREKSVSYSAVSEEWPALKETGVLPLEQLISEETLKEMLGVLTERQRQVVFQLYILQKTQKEVAEGLGIAPSTVRGIRSQAFRRIRKSVADYANH